MRILTVGNMYPPHHLGGYELAWRSWVEHARESGHDVRVLTTSYRRQAPDSGIAEDPGADRVLPWYWHEHRFPRLAAREVLALERRAQAILADRLENGADVVCWWAMGGMPLSLIEAVRRRGIAAVFVVMDEWCGYGPKVDRWQRAMDRPLVRRLGERLGVPVGLRLGGSAEQWIFLSEFLRARARESGVDPARSIVAGRGPDPAAMPPAPAREWRGELLCVGRLEQRKGQQVAVEALAHLPECRLRLIGDAEPGFGSRLRELARRLGVADRVELAQPGRAGIAGAYATADALLFPVQWDEPWGFVPLEAMAVGRPVLASGTGGSAEYLRDGENALLYSPRDDAAALAAAVRQLAGDAALRERLRRGGRETAARFTESGFNQAVTAAVEAAPR